MSETRIRLSDVGALMLACVFFVLTAHLGRAEEPPPVELPVTAEDRTHWAYVPVVRLALPEVRARDWCRTPVDRFILAQLERKGLDPLPEADRLTLLRRVTFDLTGLPPTIEEMTAFLRDRRPDAYERVVERLLGSPAYGERWAQHWLDLARFAETDGFEHDHVRPQAWRYRDWVIAALNADMPYDRFLSWQLAGDELAPESPEAVTATGFLLSGPDMPDLNLQDERRHQFLNSMTATVGEVLLGLQFGCCQCHDHKADPISQYDFYRLRAFFEPLDLFDDHPLPGAGPAEPAKGRIARDRDGAAPAARLWVRGDFRRPGPEVPPAFPRVVEAAHQTASPADEIDQSDARRARLARWLVDEQNPLTTRVLVNRVWQGHFGAGLVSTPSDFGLMGDWPSHPELLDWLADEFIARGWSLKELHRLLITSAVYRTSSRPVTPEGSSSLTGGDALRRWTTLVEQDPENRWLGRMRRRRLEGETIRDAMLQVAGRLNRSAGGPGVRPPLPAEVVTTLRKDQWPVTSPASDHDRRSIYLFVRRNLRYPLFEVFDRPDMNLSCARRSQTTTAPQALHVLNSEFSQRCAEDLAGRLRRTSEDPGSWIEQGFQLVLGRPPDPAEAASAAVFLQNGEPPVVLVDFCLALLNTNEFVYID